ncbi:hypothetical protein C0995_015824, partial [Termitomyces sp. Mi166
MPHEESSSSSKHAREVLKNLKNGVIQKSEVKALQVYVDMARWIPLSISPFINLGSVLLAGMGYLEDGEQDNEQENDLDSDKEELLLLYDMIVDIQPHMEDVLEGLSKDTGTFYKLKMVSNTAKTNDTSFLKPAIICYLPKDANDEVKPSLLPTSTRAVQGFQNQVTAHQLCLIKKLAEFDANP